LALIDSCCQLEAEEIFCSNFVTELIIFFYKPQNDDELLIEHKKQAKRIFKKTMIKLLAPFLFPITNVQDEESKSKESANT
jgi:hypothetical protein